MRDSNDQLTQELPLSEASHIFSDESLNSPADSEHYLSDEYSIAPSDHMSHKDFEDMLAKEFPVKRVEGHASLRTEPVLGTIATSDSHRSVDSAKTFIPTATIHQIRIVYSTVYGSQKTQWFRPEYIRFQINRVKKQKGHVLRFDQRNATYSFVPSRLGTFKRLTSVTPL